MPHHSPPPLIACANSSEDPVALLADVMKHEGWRAVMHVTPAKLGAQPTVVQAVRRALEGA